MGALGFAPWANPQRNPALWAGLELRVHLAPRVSLSVGLRFENLFRFERFFEGEEGGERSDFFQLSQFRFGSLAMICVHI